MRCCFVVAAIIVVVVVVVIVAVGGVGAGVEDAEDAEGNSPSEVVGGEGVGGAPEGGAGMERVVEQARHVWVTRWAWVREAESKTGRRTTLMVSR